jgi:tetratricopeptide (TPR) repeat protein
VEEERFESWKEISAYLKRNIRTCQYWEKKLGLPVHRLEGSPKARVFGYKRELDRWIEEKLKETEQPAKKTSFISILQKRFFSLSAIALISLVIITLIIWQLFREKKIVRLPSSKPLVIIMPFHNNSGDESLEHLSLALSDMLITDLSQSRYVSVLRKDQVFSILLQLDLHKAQSFSSDDLRKVARNVDATHIIQGSYIKLGQVYRIDIDIKDAHSMKSIYIGKVEGEESSLSSMIDELTRKIKSHVNLTDEAIAHDIDERVGKVTTNSPQAYKYYIEGRNQHNFNEYSKSIESMEKALEIDPEFALAYRSISESYNNLGFLSKSRDYAKKALEFSDRITDRERCHLQSQFYLSSEKTWGQALDANLKLIQLYPDDIGGIDLATLYFLLEQWDEAIEHYQVFVQNQEISYFPYRGAASSYEAKGMYDKAAEILETYLHDISEHHSVRWLLAYQYLCQGKYGLALDEAKKLDPWNADIKGYIYHCSGEWDKAEREYLNMLDSRISRDVISARRLLGSLYLLQGRYDEAERQLLQGVAFADDIGELSWKHEIHSALAYFYFASGNPEKALEESNSALGYAVDDESVRRQADSLHLRGIILVSMKLLDEAQRTADELKELVENWLSRKIMRYYYHLAGKIELERNNFREAIGYFKKAMTLLPYQHYEWYYRIPPAQALFYESIASAYYKSGDFESAQEEYEKIISLTTGKIWYGDIFRNGFYLLAKVYEQKGQREEAIKHYEKFLSLLKGADSGIVEIDAAKKQLAILTGQ